jgi:hypothetical protein
MHRLIAAFAVWLFIAGVGCSGSTPGEGGAVASPTAPTPTSTSNPTSTATGSERYVTVGFWNDPACGGVPVSQNRFPVHYADTQCYSWPGRSGENSASRFSCGTDSFSYTQWTTLICSGGQNPAGTRKTSNLTGCTQDFPPTLYARVLDFSGCQGATP